MSLPFVLQITEQTIPAVVPYIEIPPAARASAEEYRWKEGGNLKVGVVWAGNPSKPRNYLRSIPFKEFQSLFDSEGYDFYSLQVSSEGTPVSQRDERLTDLAPHIGDMADTAAYVAQLDLIISVDTAVAHLAGALGKDTWLLVSTTPDWRWFRARSDSPWYPTMTIFRQQNFMDWSAPLSAVRQSLTALARKQSREGAAR